MNTFETVEKAREYASSRPDVTHIVEIEPGQAGINPFVCLKCPAKTLASALAKKPMREIKRVIGDVADLQAEARAAREERIKANIPGLEELRASYDDIDRYSREFNRMMADEMNDGARPPKPPRKDQAELTEKYPVAAAYLKAESWSMASHYAKSSAGSRAMKRIENGEDSRLAIAAMESEWSAHVEAHAWD